MVNVTTSPERTPFSGASFVLYMCIKWLRMTVGRGVGVGVFDGVAVGVGVGVEEGIGVALGVGVGVGVGFGVIEGVGLGVGVGLRMVGVFPPPIVGPDRKSG